MQYQKILACFGDDKHGLKWFKRKKMFDILGSFGESIETQSTGIMKTQRWDAFKIYSKGANDVLTVAHLRSRR
jgi:hypothetical protein